jgi:UDPglucose--hexose-1-phosphate uridylyltransferase
VSPAGDHEVRVDPITGLRTIIAATRAERPGALAAVAPPTPIDPATDPFAPGNEDSTPPELAREDDGAGGWAVRVVPNRYPSLVADAPEPEASARPDLFTALPAAGAHEVIVNAPDLVGSLADLTPQACARAVAMWRARMRAHEGASCIHLHGNEREAGGASLPHTHAQLTALPFVPALVARERERFGAYMARTMGGDLLADVVQEEVRRRERVVAIDAEAVLLAPYASPSPYALTLVPRVPRMRFEEDGPDGASLLHRALTALKVRFGASPPLTLWVRTAPDGAERFCWRIEIRPRLAAEAGLELGTGLHLNPVAPEAAAAELRELF